MRSLGLQPKLFFESFQSADGLYTWGLCPPKANLFVEGSPRQFNKKWKAKKTCHTQNR